MKMGNSFSNIKKFFQEYWREITIGFLVILLLASLLAFLRERDKNRREKS
jgi:hypothetical protein